MHKYLQLVVAATLACFATFALAGEEHTIKTAAPAGAKNSGESHKAAAESEKVHSGTGKVNSIDSKTGKVNITHEPITSLGWSAMTMDFQVKDKAGLAKVKPGDQVEFKLTVPARGQYVITEIKPKS